MDRVRELEKRNLKLRKEVTINGKECQHQYTKWLKYNRRYLRLQKRLESVAKPLVLDINDPARLQQMTDLLALDAERAKAQAALTGLLRRELKIFGKFKQGYLDWNEVMGDEDTPYALESLKMLAERAQKQYQVRRQLGKKLLHHALGTAHA